MNRTPITLVTAAVLTVAVLAVAAPAASGAATRRCHAPPDGFLFAQRGGVSITVVSARGTSCANAKRIFLKVAGWVDSGKCYRTLCDFRHRMNDGYFCAVRIIGDSAYRIRCHRDGREVVGNTET
jgi:hypothetical protein